MNDTPALVAELNTGLGLSIVPTVSFEDLETQLADYINECVQSQGRSFQKIISILYRIDVSEQRLRSLLEEYPGTAAGKIIAGLIIDRQLEKIKSRREHRRQDNEIDENEKW